MTKEGKLDDALAEFKKGYAIDKDSECLVGIVGVAMMTKDVDLLGKFIDPIMQLAESELLFLKVAVAYSLQIQDRQMYGRCLVLARREWLEKDHDLSLGIARGAVMFFAEKKKEQKK